MLLFQTKNRKRKPRRFSLIRLRFACCASRSLSFVHFFTKKKPEVNLANRLNGLNGLAHLCNLVIKNQDAKENCQRFFPQLSFI